MGIGEALARCFAEGGHNLVLVARSADKLELLSDEISTSFGVDVHVEPLDLLDPGAPRTLLNKLQERAIDIDILVNNAGLLEQGEFVEIAPERHQQILQLNVCSLTDMLAHFLPPMIERGGGRIMNVASTSSFVAVPWLASYAASKAYVLSLTESLSVELKDSGVTATAFCPGYTATDMMTDDMKKLPSFMIGDVTLVAREGYEACMRGDVVRVPGRWNRAMVNTSRHLPKWLALSVSASSSRPG
jgi:short-subunit dehydrogenase